MSSLPELFSAHHIVQALNTPNLDLFKYMSLSFAVVGIGMDIYNIVMYILFQRVYLAPNPIVEKKKNSHGGSIFGKWGQSLKEQQQF